MGEDIDLATGHWPGLHLLVHRARKPGTGLGAGQAVTKGSQCPDLMELIFE